MGTLFLVSTPVGNLDDITLRAIETFNTVSIICCEDTRRTGLLVTELIKRGIIKDIPRRYIRFSDHVEQQKIPEIITYLMQDQHVMLVSDAGTPLIADPGYRLVKEVHKRNIPVVPVPGASAALTALVASGLPCVHFMFLGYVLENLGKQTEQFQWVKSISEAHSKLVHPTYIWYVAPHKLLTTLGNMKSVFGNCDIVLARELTKIHEQIWRGSIEDAKTEFEKPKGEFVLLFHPSREFLC